MVRCFIIRDPMHTSSFVGQASKPKTTTPLQGPPKLESVQGESAKGPSMNSTNAMEFKELVHSEGYETFVTSPDSPESPGAAQPGAILFKVISTAMQDLVATGAMTTDDIWSVLSTLSMAVHGKSLDGVTLSPASTIQAALLSYISASHMPCDWKDNPWSMVILLLERLGLGGIRNLTPAHLELLLQSVHGPHTTFVPYDPLLETIVTVYAEEWMQFRLEKTAEMPTKFVWMVMCKIVTDADCGFMLKPDVMGSEEGDGTWSADGEVRMYGFDGEKFLKQWKGKKGLLAAVDWFAGKPSKLWKELALIEASVKPNPWKVVTGEPWRYED